VRTLGLISALALGLTACSAPEHRVILVFPGQALMEQTTRVELGVYRAKGDRCSELKQGQAAGLELVLERSTSFPFDTGLSVGELKDGSFAFVAVAYNSNTTPRHFLAGCVGAEISVGGEAQTIRVVLEELRGSCSAGATEACYDGPDSTASVGRCAAGTTSCNAGYFTSCVGQQLPAEETCNGEDDDCDGVVDNISGTCDLDAGPPDDGQPGDGPPPDANPDGQVDLAAPCTDGTFECLTGGGARRCVAGVWKVMGSCPLGCEQATKSCRVPSNVDADSVFKGSGDVETKGATMAFDTDTGEIKSGTTVVRAAGVGDKSGIYYEQKVQTGSPGLGIFSLKKLVVDAAGTVTATGVRALVLLASDAVTIDGVIDVSATASAGGPGAFDGGKGNAAGGGPGAGGVSKASATGKYCAGGSGGGGHGGAGGAGGKSACAAPDDFAGGVGGKTGGAAGLVPLAGGSGGAGSVKPASVTGSTTGAGGGGGGAVQIVSAATITVGAKGGINAGGGGGGKSISAGGAGGGAGGAILFESPLVTVSVGGVLAANGGGGGGGDCT
jgi:hypothetical protein